MISLRRNSGTAGAASTLTLFLTICALLAAFPAAATAAPEASEEGATPQLAFEPGSYDFGLQEANHSNSQTMIQLRNNGEAMAQVYSVNIVGLGSGAFSIGMNDCDGRHLNPNETCAVQVNFGPYDAVPFTAQLRASSEKGTTFFADLSGEGGRARLGVATDPTNFGAAAVGSAGVTKTIDVTNSGNMPGGSFIAVIAGGAIGSFHLLDENCTGVLLSPTASCTLMVSFQPLSTGVKTARLGLFGDQDGGTQVTLTGVGTEPEPELLSSVGSAGTNVASPQPRGKHGARARLQRRKRIQRQRQRRHRVAVFAQRAIR